MNKRITKIIIAFLIMPLIVISAPAVTLSTNTAWTWMKGANVSNQFGTYGTQGIPATNNTPGARAFPAIWTDSSGAIWLFGGEGYGTSGSVGYLNDLWKLDPATMNWTWMKGASLTNQIGTYGTLGVAGPTNTPGGRACAMVWTNSSGTVWLFGGAGIDGLGSTSWKNLNDLWQFNPATTNWTWVKGPLTNSQPGIYGTLGVPATNNIPGARRLGTMWTESSGAMWLFGGRGFGVSGPYEGYLNDLWKFDPTTTNWTWMKGANTTNQPGTYGTQGVPDSTNTPGARWQAVSWTESSGTMWLFGGRGYGATGDSGNLSDLWKFDPTTTNWTWIKGSSATNSQPAIYGTQGVPATSNTPGTRWGAVSWTESSGTMWLFGGYGFDASGSSGYLNDLWIFDPVTTNWTWMKGSTNANQFGTYGTIGVPNPTNIPGGREWSASWTDSSDALWLFGGYGYAASGGMGYLNDLWKFDVLGGISLATNALVFSATYEGTNPASQTIGMTNIGLGEFTYTNVITYSAGASGWLTVLPATGTVALSGATILTNQINISGLDAGTYYATNQVTAADATNNPQTVVVTLNVNLAAISSGVCADYDGDRLADPAIYDEATGTWKVRLSSANYYLVTTTLNGLGGPGYASVSADYDGDRKADPAVYQEATGIWIIMLSSANYEVVVILAQTLGEIGYSGVPADYDGDQLADPGVYQRTQGDWKVLLSSANYYEIDKPDMLGGTGYRAVAADYDGDMKGDPAIYGESNGLWAFMLSSAGYVTFAMTQALGGTGYIPVPADYDGDGYADPAVRSETGNEWIVMFSTAGYTSVPVTILFE